MQQNILKKMSDRKPYFSCACIENAVPMRPLSRRVSWDFGIHIQIEIEFDFSGSFFFFLFSFKSEQDLEAHINVAHNGCTDLFKKKLKYL